MKFFTIPPISQMELTEQGTGGLFVLAHLFAKDTVYRNYCIERRKQDKDLFILLDNGAAENSLVNIDVLIHCIQELKPTEVIAPDVLFDGETTLQNLELFKSKLKQLQIEVQIMGCPQGKDFGQWLSCYKSMLEDDEVSTIGLSKIALPFIIFGEKQTDCKIKQSRQFVYDFLKINQLIRKPIHCLGAGEPDEFVKYKGDDLMRSTDSCFSIWAGMNDIDWSDGVFDRIRTPHNYFELHLSKSQLQLAKKNIDYLASILTTSTVDTSSVGYRYNTNKVKMSLLDLQTLQEAAKVLAFGEKKYSRNNWKKGFIHSDIVDSILRHLSSYQQGQLIDEESGLKHSAHILSNAMFLCYMDINKPELNDFINQ